ncbi:DUF551 domain-containing protein [Klebsiella variicola]|uniref:DUF551 domain-containing protein n=1 Tax=Klebsiella variicola TaxID=244366 RepID=UPI002B1FB273|nr:DUF551 domain-containing protein [Klebsiella variicola]MEA5436483.1 DUF551 domain-containing protein [Klebsiella variicola]
MTKSTITREQLLEIIETDHVQCGEASYLARMALAAMDSEPVAIIDQANLDYLRSGADADVWPPEREEMGDVLLYRHAQPAPVAQKEPISFDEWSRKCALQITLCYPDFREKAQYIWDSARETQQPAPVVPNGLRLALSNAGIAAPESDEMLAATCEKHIQAVVTWVKDRKPFQSAPVVPSFEEWLSAANRKPLGWVKDAMREASDACRAAMLQAGNSPVIPDGYRLQPISEYEAMCATVNSDEWPQRWIPVSERMPEDRTQVILWDAEIGEVTSGHYSHKTHTFYHCGDAIQNEITHWMPLPAAPQEVKP